MQTRQIKDGPFNLEKIDSRLEARRDNQTNYRTAQECPTKRRAPGKLNHSSLYHERPTSYDTLSCERNDNKGLMEIRFVKWSIF